MNSISVAIDYFGVAGSSNVEILSIQSSNARARKVAFNNLFRMAKACGQIARNAEPEGLSIFVNKAGGQRLQFLYSLPSNPKESTNAS